MKITRVPIRKPAPLPETLATAVNHLINDDQLHIKNWVLQTWNFPRGDLFQFVAVLNRFDTLLESVCKEYQLENQIQKEPFSPETKEMLLAILHFSKILFENCTNRNLYNSYEHLNNLLSTTDIDILESVLRLMMRPAQRVNNPRAVQSSFLAHQDKVTELARGGSIADLTSTDISARKGRICMSFFRTGEGKEEGLQSINIVTTPNQWTDRELFWKLVEEYQVPKESHFELLNRVRIANHMTETSVCRQLLIIRFAAIVIMAHTMSETIAQNRVFIYEPHLVPQIAQLISYENDIPIDIQTYALYALDGIARHRSKVTEILSAFNAAANHGVLLHILRQLCQPNSTYTVEFLDALFTLLTFLIQTSPGSTMLMSAGITSTLIQVLDHPSTTSTTYKQALVKTIGLLDTLMSNISTSIPSFYSANGLEMLLKVIQTQVDQCIQQYNDTKKPADYESLTLVKNSLRFLVRMMESSDTADGLRNLVESSIPHTIMKVMEYNQVFGPGVFALVVNVSTTFIHNEPTSLSVLQEIKLPQTFLRTFASYEQSNFEVLMAALHSFGAICLNTAGLEMFHQANPLPHFFDLMTAPSFVTNPSDVGNATALGTTMDELIRHHPKLKTDVFKCANQLLQQLVEVGNSEEGKPLDNSHQLVVERQVEDPPQEKAECLLLGFVDLVARFLEGFMRNVDNVKGFVKYGGPELLLSYYSLPMLPFDFSVSNAFDSLSFVFRVIADVSPEPLAKMIVDKVYESSRFIFTDLDKRHSKVYDLIEENGKTEESTMAADELFHKFSVLFGYIGLFSTIFASAILTNSKHAARMVEWGLSLEQYGSITSLLGEIHRVMVWQNILLRDAVPRAWYCTAQQSAEDKSLAVDLKDPRVINVRRFKLLISEVPPALMPVLQGMIKVSVKRRLLPTELSLTMRCKWLAFDIATLFKQSLCYMDKDSPICKYDYYSSMFSMISMLLLDDRSRTALETPIAVACQEVGLIDDLVDTLLPQFWTAAEACIQAENQDECMTQRIYTCIELLLAILHHLGCSKMFHNSPHTSILTSLHPDQDFDERRPMNPYHWMATMHLKLSSLYKYLQSPVLPKFSRHVLHSLLRCVTQNMKGEGEQSRRLRTKSTAIITTAATGASHDDIEHFEVNRRALISMGFEPERVDQALREMQYGLCALDNLFTRQLVQHTVASGPPRLEISPELESSNPLTAAEFDAGVRILANMWYDPALAAESLRENNNLAQAALSLSRYQPSAIRIPTNGGAQTQPPPTQVNENDDDDDQYEDIDTDDEEFEDVEEEEEEEEEDNEDIEGDENMDKNDLKKIIFKNERMFSVKSDSKQVESVLSQLDNVRKSMRGEIPKILSRLVDERSDIDFEVRSLMAVLCCSDPNHLAENTKQTIHLFFGGVSKGQDQRAMFESSINKIRIFALMLREPAMQDVMSLLITTMSDYMDWFDFLDLIVNYPDFPDPKWLTTLFLILEASLAQADEPQQLPLPDVDGVVPAVDDSNIPSTPAIVTAENRSTLMKYCINLLKMESLSQDNLISTLRIIVRLTKHHDAAYQFVELGGLEPLFQRPKTSFKALKIQQTYIIMILRHIIESKAVLSKTMHEWLSFWFNASTQSFLDVDTFVRNNNNLVLRDPNTFLEVSSKMCCLSAYRSGNIKSIRYVQQELEKEEDNQDGKDFSFLVVQFLVNQLIHAQANKEEESDIKTAYTGFLLECLFELVSSYPSCKHDIIKLTGHDATNNSNPIRQSIVYGLTNELLPYNAIHASTDQERKRQGVSMWVASLLVGMCYDTTKHNDNKHSNMLEQVRRHVLDVVAHSLKNALQSDATTSVKYNHYFALTELCHRILNARPTSINPGLNIKADSVMEVSKLMLEKNFVPILISVISDVDVSYPHAKLILNSILRPLEQLTKMAIRIHRNSPEELVIQPKMIDDANEAIQQTTAATTIVTDNADDNDNMNEDEDMYVVMSTDEESDATDEVNDLYRNSSLAMFDSTALEEESDEDESSEDDDVEMASSGEEVISDGDDSGEISSIIVDSDDVDEDTDNSDGSTSSSSSSEEDEDEEMEDLMRSHRYHHSDTEEEVESDSSNDDSDTDSSTDSGMSYSSSEYDSADESLNSDRSDSIHSNDSHDMAWHLDDESRPHNEEGYLGHRRHRHRHEIMSDTDTDEEDMEIDPSDYDLDPDANSEDLDQEELDDVERNLALFHNNGGGNDVAHLINPTVRGSLNNVAGNNRSFERDSIILHPLLRSAVPNAGVSTVTANGTGADSSLSAETAILCGANSNHLQAYEDIIGGSAVRILENLFAQQRQRNESDEAASSNEKEGDAGQDNKDTLSILKEFQPMQTVDRWTQEVQMVYILPVASAKAAKLTNTLIARLIETAKQEPQDEIAAELDNATTAEAVDSHQWNNASAELDAILQNVSEGDEIIIDLDGGEDNDEEIIDDDDDEEEEDRVTVTIDGEEVDITGTGIDVEFLEALPDDLRAEVITQQMAERHSSVQSMDEDEISPEFLAALPPDIRAEILRQESIDRSRRQSREPSNNQELQQSNVPNSASPSQPNTVEPENNGPGSRNTPSASNIQHPIAVEADSDHHHHDSRKAVLHRDGVRIVDRSQLATLVRLLFVPQSISKALLNRLLLSLCENSKTRRDLLSLLICILQDGSTDLAAVDRSFMQLSIQKGKSSYPDKMESVKVSAPAENVPNLITQRCLEILYYVVTWNQRSLAYFLTEHDNLGHSGKHRHSTSGRGKPSKTSKLSGEPKYPILILIGLLDRPVFINNTTLMEQLMNLLANMCRPFPNIVKRYKEKTESLESEDMDTGEKSRQAPKLPVIPEKYLLRIADVLSSGECSSHTFQSTVSVLSHLASLDGALDTIIHGLTVTANACGKQIIIDLQQLYSILYQSKPGTELESSALAQFSATSSHQARLLRVLKAMDYLYTRKRNLSSDQAEQNEKAVLQIYSKLDFLQLWDKLGACLDLIQEREDLLNVASVLLPLVESFMAVSKYATPKDCIAKSATEGSNPAEEYFLTFTEAHKKILNIMVRNNPSLMSGSFSLLIRNPKILEFDNKRNFFVQQLHKRTEPKEHYPPLRLSVRRAHVFEDTYRKLQGLTGKEIKHGKLNVHFQGEEGVDAGGVAREWFSVLARQMFDPNYALFITSAADKLTYQPNRASGVNSEHLSYFKCVGRIIGKAIHDGRLLDAYFTRSFYKLMLGRSVDYRDMEAVDPDYYKSLVWILDNDITDVIDLTFSMETDDFGTSKTIDLKPNGRNIPVTEENKHEYVSLITEQKLVLAIKDQVNAFLDGFHDVIPASLIQIFTEQELELLISGLPDIDIDEWKANTVYEGYTLSSPQIQWFWRAVRSFDQEERAKLLQFATGTSKVPLEGFAELQGSNGVQKFQIHKEFGDVNRLPSAHTCFNQIDLPQYLTYEDLRSNLFKAISECSTGFAFQ